MQLKTILQAYGLDREDCSVMPFGNGLINRTWKISSGSRDKNFVLQRLNVNIFKRPEDVAANIRLISDYLAHCFPAYLFMAPLKTVAGKEMFYEEGSGYYRVFPFVEGSQTFDVLNCPAQAFEAARQFALFTRLLSGLDAAMLKTTLADFHNLSLRYGQFRTALVQGNAYRLKKASALIQFLLEQESIIHTYECICNDPGFKVRVMHHDTKISNVLFDQGNNGLCVIDLDTVMPGFFISDVGDMMRTYLSDASEEEQDFEKIGVREEYFKAIVEGYFSEMHEELSEVEKNHFLYAGKFMIYMQALRFLTDYLNDDVYYGARYEGHNLVRARNQAVLLQRLMEKENVFREIIAGYQPMTV